MSSYQLIPLHGIGSRHDLPLPFGFVVAGAAAALVVSFVILFLAWRTPRFVQVKGIGIDQLTHVVDHRAFRALAALLVSAVYSWAALALFAGEDRLTNPVFGFVYVWMWVGLVPLSVVLGQFWRATNPVRTIHRALCFLARVEPDHGLAHLPPRIGVWPAAVALFGFGWLELVQPDRTSLPVLRLWALTWLVILVLGAVVFGRGWIAAADPFETYASTVAQLSPWRRIAGRFRLVNPLAGLTAWDPPAGAAAVVSVLLGNTAFDSFANTSGWIETVQDSAVDSIWWATGGLLSMIIIVGATFSLAAMWMARFAPGNARRPRDYPRLMAGSVVPIAIGYAVAHYTTLLVVEGQRTAINMSDPLGRGWNVFGSAEMGVNSAIFNQPALIAFIQLGAILTGHILGIVIAHEKSLALIGAAPTGGSAADRFSRRRSLLAQGPMLAVMIFYTCSGLVLLFSP